MRIRLALRESNALRCALWVLLFSMSASPSFAFQSIVGDPIFDRFNISVGTFFYTSGTQVTLNGAFGTRGVPVDLENQLGFKDVNRFRLDGYWRFTTHQRLRFMYFDATRHSTKTISQDIHYGDTTFPIGATVSARNKVTVGELVYEYDFLVRQKFSLGASFGIHNIDFGLRLSANTTTGTSSQTQSLNQNASADGPMPLIGLAGIWRPESWLYFTVGAQALKVTVNPYSGTLQNYSLSAVWQPTKHFGVGAGYDYFRMNAGVSKFSFNGDLGWRYSGARVFLTGSF